MRNNIFYSQLELIPGLWKLIHAITSLKDVTEFFFNIHEQFEKT